MKRIKNEFTFQYNKQTIEVRLLGGVFCAIFGEIAKPLDIVLHDDTLMHLGKISIKDGKFLSWLPEEAIEEITPKELLIELRAILNNIIL